jgi:hypothetical protein
MHTVHIDVPGLLLVTQPVIHAYSFVSSGSVYLSSRDCHDESLTKSESSLYSSSEHSSGKLLNSSPKTIDDGYESSDIWVRYIWII